MDENAVRGYDIKCILNSKHRLFVRKDGKMRTARKLKEEVARTVGFLA